MHDQLQRRVKDLGTYAINGANTIAWDPGAPVEIERVILVYTTGNTTPGNALTFQMRPVAGAAANQVTLGTATSTATTAAGDVDYMDVGIDKASSSASGGTQNFVRTKWTIAPGQDFAIVSDGAGSAGVVDVFVEYVLYPWGNRGAAAGTIRKLTQTA